MAEEDGKVKSTQMCSPGGLKCTAGSLQCGAVSSTENKYVNVRNRCRFSGPAFRRNVSAWSDQL